jgi:IS5 family transposase
LHAPEVECIGKGKAQQPYEFGVYVGVVVAADSGLMLEARSFPGNPYDGHTFAEQLEQAKILMEDTDVEPRTVYADLGYLGVDEEIVPAKLVHRGKYKSLTKAQREALRGRQAVEPAIGHAKRDHGMGRCWLKGSQGDALRALLWAAGFHLHWLLRMIDHQGIVALIAFFVALIGAPNWAGNSRYGGAVNRDGRGLGFAGPTSSFRPWKQTRIT